MASALDRNCQKEIHRSMTTSRLCNDDICNEQPVHSKTKRSIPYGHYAIRQLWKWTGLVIESVLLHKQTYHYHWSMEDASAIHGLDGEHVTPQLLEALLSGKWIFYWPYWQRGVKLCGVLCVFDTRCHVYVQSSQNLYRNSWHFKSGVVLPFGGSPIPYDYTQA